MTYISPKPVSLQALRTWLNNAAAFRNGRTMLIQRSFTRAGACLQFVWLNWNNSNDCDENFQQSPVLRTADKLCCTEVGRQSHDHMFTKRERA